MSHTDWTTLIDRLRGATYQRGIVTQDSVVHSVEFDPGLTDAEVRSIETEFGFCFPKDLREFLQTALPRGSGFPEWRADDRAALHDWLDEPRQGILFDVEHAAFWLAEWGDRPTSLTDAVELVSNCVRNAPRLIPIFAHRMMPDEPHESGNPVFSVYQTDIIYYANDLSNYLEAEFQLERSPLHPSTPRPIRFWHRIVS